MNWRNYIVCWSLVIPTWYTNYTSKWSKWTKFFSPHIGFDLSILVMKISQHKLISYWNHPPIWHHFERHFEFLSKNDFLIRFLIEFSYNMAGFEPVADKSWLGIHGFPIKIRYFQFRTLQRPGLIREQIKNIIFH